MSIWDGFDRVEQSSFRAMMDNAKRQSWLIVQSEPQGSELFSVQVRVLHSPNFFATVFKLTFRHAPVISVAKQLSKGMEHCHAA